MAETGHCKHGEFVLTEGCEKCVAERRRVDMAWDKSQFMGNPPEPGVASAALALRPGEDLLEVQIKVVAETRERARKAEETKALIQVAFERQNRAILQETVDTANQVREAEAKLRELTLAVYTETGNKAPARGVSVKIFQTLDYDPKEALKWAIAHQIALSLDKKSFETLAKASPLDFVIISLEARAQIAQDLNGLFC